MNGVLLAALAALVLLPGLFAWLRWSVLREDRWSIAVYEGGSPFELGPAVGRAVPALTAADVTDARADFVADPFLLQRDDRWWMFLEVYERDRRLGSIAWASSPDLARWTYGGIVLREPFHLSYPQVIEDDGKVYMVPERGASGTLGLYVADAFPAGWREVATLLRGEFYDATLFRYEGGWWMFATDPAHDLHLFMAPALRGPWTPHPASPVVRADVRTARPAGRVLSVDDALYRLAQDGYPTYGSSVRIFRILTLTAERYAEEEARSEPLLAGSGEGWNANGMHHADIARLAPGRWIASVDGNRIARRFNWRAGARRMQRALTRIGRKPTNRG